ncbi:MAG: hypothetical protein A2015_13760 [Spirochaetes bacterium GWF1_31_7]|nr:MAG: hypothetical protein A2Y30_11065 [Spirochaetes bacterium GWE1_32_154]OHD46143.1 MAG: hypothetical protein A2Y29_08555 [Spirochaetes bacterium GWE2_31_10]OHD49884.1 MAG: hypothetical protein A2015_13760 [Spirochaetes bacterium GWF1_31_7]OHD80099.1 MAG: hypothetical protein A2355_11990 [Spirochaetes bacterium RIFOXYB1_FULL_32_8]HBD96287.1 hypothetical protein [Spirochaetia bacterium]
MKQKELFNLPNLLSLSRIFFGIAFLVLFFIIISDINQLQRNLILQIIALVIFLLAIISDGLDGYYARKLNIVTDIGKHLDPLTDSIFFMIVFATFTIIKLMNPVYLFIIVIRELSMHLIIRPLVKSKGSSLPASIYGKLKMFAQCIFSMIILIMIIASQIMQLYHINTVLIDKITRITSLILFSIIVFLSVMSMIIYLVNLKKILKTANTSK